jgi:hypothetical protein
VDQGLGSTSWDVMSPRRASTEGGLTATVCLLVYFGVPARSSDRGNQFRPLIQCSNIAGDFYACGQRNPPP